MAFSETISSIPGSTKDLLLHPGRISWSYVTGSFAVQLVLVCCAVVICGLRVKTSASTEFSGPPAWPIVGNLPSIYHKNAEKQFFVWAKAYGDVIRVQMGSMPIIVVNSAAAAKHIFTGNSAALSSRPIFYTFHHVRH
jgi:hypothetical protein